MTIYLIIPAYGPASKSNTEAFFDRKKALKKLEVLQDEHGVYVELITVKVK